MILRSVHWSVPSKYLKQVPRLRVYILGLLLGLFVFPRKAFDDMILGIRLPVIVDDDDDKLLFVEAFLRKYRDTLLRTVTGNGLLIISPSVLKAAAGCKKCTYLGVSLEHTR